MGYTTRFEGAFQLSKLPSAEVIVRLNEIYDEPEIAEGNPGSYCQWKLSRDCQSIEWDGGEKFYNYTEWMQWLIDNVFTPDGVEVSGTITFAGEEVTDVGILTIEGSTVKHLTTELIKDEFAELKAFKEYVLSTDYVDEILEGWRSR